MVGQGLVIGVGPRDYIRRRVNSTHITDKIGVVDPYYKQRGGRIRWRGKMADIRYQKGTVIIVE
jgi:hypothetical protein